MKFFVDIVAFLVQETMRKFINLYFFFTIKIPRRVRNQKRYIENELKYKLMPGGDPRSVFTKKVHRCRFLELSDHIYTSC
jgi:hypothetical protein